MADCSSAGTAIDRTARVLMGAGNSDATKHMGALLGHAATAGMNTQLGAMPLTAPDHLSIARQQQYGGMNSSTPQVPSMVLSNGQTMVPGHGQHLAPPSQQILPPNNPMHLMQSHQHQQQHVMAQASMFHQQQQIMQHQMQIMAAQQQEHQAKQRQLKQDAKVSAAALEKPLSEETNEVLNQYLKDDLGNWHDGLEDEVQQLNYDDDMTKQADLPDGQTLEDLATAWADAEAEYNRLAEEDPEFANLFQGTEAWQDPSLRAYEFVNKEEDVPNDGTNWMEEGAKHFRQGNLKDAIRAYEMELQQNNPDNATAWRMLGRCHAENDMDPEAIKCLEAAVDRDPFSPESLLALGVSYVNELNHEKSLENMKAWFTHNPKYAGMNLPEDIYGAGDGTAGVSGESAFEEVKSMLLSALAFDSTDAADVHEALGVIYNVIKDYDAAAESFRQALVTRPDDYQLWNKLGATLANGSQSDQALPAYHKALQLKPKYARAWLNMAISHSNLQDHNEAVRCYLQTLSLNPGATHCWTYLRMALSCAERWDLLPLVFAQDLGAFKEHFDFIYDK